MDKPDSVSLDSGAAQAHVDAGVAADQAALAAADRGTAIAPNAEIPPGDGSDPGAAPLLAGKYKDRDSLVEGINQVRSKLSMSSEYSSDNMSDDQLAGAYKDYESMLGRAAQPADKDTPATGDSLAIPKDPEPAPTGPIDMISINQEWLENKGALKDETYEALEKTGLSREQINYFQGLAAADGQRYTEAGYEMVGGKDEYGHMVDWAKNNLEQNELQTFTSLVDSFNPDARDMAIQTMYSKYKDANPNGPTLVGEGNANVESGGGVEGFQNTAQYKAAIADPRYDKDPAFRAEVDKKLEIAHNAGLV